jgi:hypothetical protein
VFAHGDANESAEKIESQIAGVRRATRRYFDVQTAVDAGYATLDPTQFINTQSD